MKNEITDTQRMNLLETSYYEFKPAYYDGLDHDRLYLDIWYDINLSEEEIIKIIDTQIECRPEFAQLNFDFQYSYKKEYFDKDTERLNWFIKFTQSESFKGNTVINYTNCWLGKNIKRYEYYERTYNIEMWEIRAWIDYKMNVLIGN